MDAVRLKSRGTVKAAISRGSSRLGEHTSARVDRYQLLRALPDSLLSPLVSSRPEGCECQLCRGRGWLPLVKGRMVAVAVEAHPHRLIADRRTPRSSPE